MIQGGSKSFFMASHLLPKRVREAAYAIYAFCRLSDDAVDVEGGQIEAVDRLRQRLDLIYAGAPSPNPVDRSLAAAAAEFALPRVLMDALLEGLEWDVTGCAYDTIEDLHAYCARVAGSVGGMIATLMGARSAGLAARACDLGVAMQLTNIARDVGDDARAGRLYLPRAWMVEAGIDPDVWLNAPEFGPQVGAVIQRVLRHADELYRRSDSGIAGLEPAFKPSIFAARHLYAEIGHQLERDGLDSISRRTTVSGARKVQLVAHAVVRSVSAAPVPGDLQAASLPQTRFLVDAVAQDHGWPMAAQNRRRKKREQSDLVWVIGLFETLEGRQRMQRSLR
jgi:phytoene synthase